jgi:phosphoglycerate dehydrogenase-like enzyme
MKVVCWSQNLTQERADQRARDVGLPVVDEDGVKTFQVVSKGEMFKLADAVSVHYVLGPRSVGVIGEKELGLMKPEAMIVNTSRGPLIDDDALFGALEEGRIRGAALDVFDIEPLPTKSRWRTTPWGRNGSSRVLLTPHMGYVEEEIMHIWYDETAENIEKWMRGDEVLNRLS